PAPEGTSTVVLLDHGSAMRSAGWSAAVGEARRSLLDADGTARGELVLFDTAAVRVPRARVTPRLFDSLLSAQPLDVTADYAAALRAVPAAARELRGADSVRVRMISALADAGWSAGLAPLRRAAWPGTVDLTRVPIARTPADSAAANLTNLTSVTLAAPGSGFVATALAAVGMEGPRVSPSGALPAAAASVYVVVDAPSAATAAQLLERARAGATLVVTAGAAAEPLRAALPWTGGFDLVRGGGAMWFDAETELAGAAGRVQAGGPADGARTVAAWEDGRSAAVAKRLGSGCVVFVGTALEGGELPFQAAYPAALARLARGCEATAGTADARPLDPGALAVLRGRGPAAVPASAVGAAGAGIGLGRWALAAALLIALIETLLAYRRGTAG
ncbi:MAG TPA: hypothetical protein VEQ60_02115, partial [Longimicrobium sp.]|nr:hypothetical protein [Longimicrobium sp.]